MTMKRIIMLTTLLLITIQCMCSPQSETDKLIKTTLISHGYSDEVSDYWVKVARLETANYTSTLYKYHFNLWGMSYFKNGNRSTLAAYRVYHKGKPTQFAGFKCENDAIYELVLYLDAVKFPREVSSLESFVAEMYKRHYFEESYEYYLKNIKAI